jgi:hypothetical protein
MPKELGAKRLKGILLMHLVADAFDNDDLGMWLMHRMRRRDNFIGRRVG